LVPGCSNSLVGEGFWNDMHKLHLCSPHKWDTW
jgi:hypothetical protein